MISTIQVDMERLVYEFHKKYDHVINHSPTIPSNETVALRYRLIREELEETLLAIRSDDLIEIADGIADSIVVLIGTAISYGIPIQNVFLEVHNSNMSKSMERDGGGKTIKGPNFKGPDIKGVLGIWKE